MVSKVYATITNIAVPGGSSPADSPKQFAVIIATLWQTLIIVGGLAFLLYFLMGGMQREILASKKLQMISLTALLTQLSNTSLFP